MLIIIDQSTKQIITNMGLCGLYPDGNIPGIEAPEGQQIVRISDESELAQKILTAEPNSYTLVFDETGHCIDAIVTKTLEQYWLENPPGPPDPTTEDYLIDLDFRLCMIELGLT